MGNEIFLQTPEVNREMGSEFLKKKFVNNFTTFFFFNVRVRETQTVLKELGNCITHINMKMLVDNVVHPGYGKVKLIIDYCLNHSNNNNTSYQLYKTQSAIKILIRTIISTNYN